jgi:tetrahydromethanopterin S-methyltransferase subunit E
MARERHGRAVPPPQASRFGHPVETDYANIDELAARALAGHEHVITIGLRPCYYLNPDIRQHPLPRHLIPVPVWSPFRR